MSSSLPFVFDVMNIGRGAVFGALWGTNSLFNPLILRKTNFTPIHTHTHHSKGVSLNTPCVFNLLSLISRLRDLVILEISFIKITYCTHSCMVCVCGSSEQIRKGCCCRVIARVGPATHMLADDPLPPTCGSSQTLNTLSSNPNLKNPSVTRVYSQEVWR